MAAGDVTVNFSKLMGHAAWFSGAAKIEFDGSKKLHITDEISISCWFRMAWGGAADQKICNKGDSNDKEFDIVFENGQPEAVFRYTSGELKCTYAVDMRTWTWHHYVLTGKANEWLRLYIDGALRDSKKIVDSTLPNDITKSLYLGCRVGAFQFWEGDLDNFRIHNRILSQEEITKAYNGIAPSRKKLIGEYLFEHTAALGTDTSKDAENGTNTNTLSTYGHKTVDNAIKTARTSANDKHAFLNIGTPEIMMIHVEEA